MLKGIYLQTKSVELVNAFKVSGCSQKKWFACRYTNLTISLSNLISFNGDAYDEEDGEGEGEVGAALNPREYVPVQPRVDVRQL